VKFNPIRTFSIRKNEGFLIACHEFTDDRAPLAVRERAAYKAQERRKVPGPSKGRWGKGCWFNLHGVREIWVILEKSCHSLERPKVLTTGEVNEHRSL
jgi:hypothetical protein